MEGLREEVKGGGGVGEEVHPFWLRHKRLCPSEGALPTRHKSCSPSSLAAPASTPAARLLHGINLAEGKKRREYVGMAVGEAIVVGRKKNS